MSASTKQVIVIRKDLNMRKGKMVAQGAHASATIIRQEFDLMYNALYKTVDMYTRYGDFRRWLDKLQTKICVGVDSEAELLEIFSKAQKVNLPCSLIQDAGLTEFKEPTYTAVGIGPAESVEIDKITGHLKLL